MLLHLYLIRLHIKMDPHRGDFVINQNVGPPSSEDNTSQSGGDAEAYYELTVNILLQHSFHLLLSTLEIFMFAILYVYLVFIYLSMQAIISHVYDSSKKAVKHSHLVSQIKSTFGLSISLFNWKIQIPFLQLLYHYHFHFRYPILVHPAYQDLHNKNDKDNNNPESNKTLSQWYMFNDFHITPCSTRSVVDFSFKVFNLLICLHIFLQIQLSIPCISVLIPPFRLTSFLYRALACCIILEQIQNNESQECQ